MNTPCYVIGSLLFCLSLPSAASADEFGAFVKVNVPKIAKAIEKADANFFDAITTPDFTETTGGRVVRKARALVEMRLEFNMMKSASCKIDLLSAKSVGTSGTSLTHIKMSSVTKPGKDGKSHSMAIESWGQQTWVKKGTTWKLKSIVETKEPRMWLDGIEVGAPKAAK